MMLSGGEVAVKLAGSVAKNTCVVRDELAERLGSLFCGKATAVAACHWHAAKSRLSNPTRARVIMPEKSPSGWMGFFLASYASPSNQFNSRSSRTMTGRCRSWTRTRQGGNMPILLKTEIERTAKTPIPARRARVGSLCRFRRPAERVPTRGLKTRRCADVRERCRNGKSRKRMPASGFRQREKPQAAKQEKGLTLFCVWPSTSARSAGSFGG